MKIFKFTCQKCKIQGKKNSGIIECHHIYNFRDNENLRSDIENGVCLCKKCHKKFHKIYGKRQTNQNQLKEFLNGKYY